MSNHSQPTQERDFYCQHCNGRILIPYSLPSTTGPCPHCQGIITSPAPPDSDAPVQKVPAPQAQPVQLERPAPPSRATPISHQVLETPSPEPTNTADPRSHKPATKSRRKSYKRLVITMVGLFLLLLTGGGAVYYIARHKGISLAAPDATGSSKKAALLSSEYIQEGWQDDAYRSLENFLGAMSIAEKLPYVHDSDQLREKMELFYRGGFLADTNTPADLFSVKVLSEEDRSRGIFMLTYDQAPQFDLREFFRPLAPLEVQYGIEDSSSFHSAISRVQETPLESVRAHALFKHTADGLKLDWEVFIQTKYRTFQRFVDLPEVGHAETFRVLIVEDVPTKVEDVVSTRTYRMIDPAHLDDSVRVNVNMTSGIGKTLSVINWRGTNQGAPVTRTATVELEWTGQPDSPELGIKRFICWEFLGLGGDSQSNTASTQ